MRIELKLAFLLLGFLGGNLFGTVLGYLREYFVWDGLIVLFLILLSEMISYTSYKPLSGTKRIGFTKPHHKSPYKSLLAMLVGQVRVRIPHAFLMPRYKSEIYMDKPLQIGNLDVCVRQRKSVLNLFKIGVLVGFFIDAFKVGS